MIQLWRIDDLVCIIEVAQLLFFKTRLKAKSKSREWQRIKGFGEGNVLVLGKINKSVVLIAKIL